jgi:hypothetical protein
MLLLSGTLHNKGYVCSNDFHVNCTPLPNSCTLRESGNWCHILLICVPMPGYEDDMITAEQVPGLDVIVGGHSHTFLYTPITAGPIVARGAGVNASTCVEKVG